jgi:hypothetical protein
MLSLLVSTSYSNATSQPITAIRMAKKKKSSQEQNTGKLDLVHTYDYISQYALPNDQRQPLVSSASEKQVR